MLNFYVGNHLDKAKLRGEKSGLNAIDSTMQQVVPSYNLLTTLVSDYTLYVLQNASSLAKEIN